jgi:beta-ureidopropionase / N-carbamoyl-L-amino-acid hydrolase
MNIALGSPVEERPSDRAAAHVDAQRLESSIAELARYGGRPDGGVSRQALTDIDNDARRYLIERAKRLGCEPEVDDCANLFFRRRGISSLPPVLTGSHVDTQPVGGKLDGAYGVVAGLEVLEALNDAHIQTKRPIEVVVWTNEDGSRFRPGAMGSSAFIAPAKLSQYLDSADDDGVTFRDALARSLKQLHDIPPRSPKAPIAAFIEAHIEQGPVLEQAGVALGAVTGIQGVRWYNVECTGVAAHAGTTPMDVRLDAMTMAMDIARQLNELALRDGSRTLRLTLGHWIVSPNSINTIPGGVVFSIDVRSSEEPVLVDFERSLHEIIAAHGRRSHLKTTRIFARSPTTFPQHLHELVADACARVTGRQPVRMISGAFHDAMYLAEHCPTCMLFVRSKDGISHNPAEYSSPEDLHSGAKALASLVTTLADR